VNGLKRIFISSVQREFADERASLRDYLRNDPLLRRFFEPFIFEDVPAADRRTDEVYLDEVARCDIYIGLFGEEYGIEGVDNLSPVHRELEHASRLGKHRLIFIKGESGGARHVKMQALIRQAEGELVRRRFVTTAELIAGVYASLVRYLEEKELIRHGPFDAAACPHASLADLDPDRMAWFIREARRARGFPLSDNATPDELLAHLNLLNAGRLTHAAVLLFARQPQRFLISSEIKCAHFHGTDVAKPIPSYQVYKGTVFELVDQAVDFVLSKINLRVGTRAESAQAPVAYELPPEVVREAIVNAVAHRDYTSNGSVQVMLFSNRLEVWNPGGLPASLTVQQLREPHGSIPGNPLVAEPLYLTKYIERMGTGTRDMIRLCRAAGLQEPEFAVRDGFVSIVPRTRVYTGQAGRASGAQVAEQAAGHSKLLWANAFRELIEATGQATGQAVVEAGPALIAFLSEPKTAREIQEALGLRHRETFLDNYLSPLLSTGLLERTIPDKPTSPNQKYRLTHQGQSLLENPAG
jgi:predicted HTH transcriptional regulator